MGDYSSISLEVYVGDMPGHTAGQLLAAVTDVYADWSEGPAVSTRFVHNAHGHGWVDRPGWYWWTDEEARYGTSALDDDVVPLLQKWRRPYIMCDSGHFTWDPDRAMWHPDRGYHVTGGSVEGHEASMISTKHIERARKTTMGQGRQALIDALRREVASDPYYWLTTSAEDRRGAF